jgi:hypothetical protein
MKKSNQPILLVFILFTGFVIAGCTPKDKRFNANMRFRTIVVQVNTADIHPGGDIDKYVSFPGQAPGVSLKDFTTNVSLGDTILWIGVSSSNPFEDEVLIEQINYQGGDNLLEKNTINGKNGSVMATIKKEGEKGEEEKYVIHIKVKKQGGSPSAMYQIDPKMRLIKK